MKKLFLVVLALPLIWGCARQESILIKEPVDYQKALPDSQTNPGYPLRRDVFIYKIKNGLPYQVELEMGEVKIKLNTGGLHLQSFKRTYQLRVVVITGNVFDAEDNIIGTIVRRIKIPPSSDWNWVIEEDLWHIIGYKELRD